MEIKINYKEFAAATLCKAKKDVRFYLEDYFFDSSNGRIVTTTGHVMFNGVASGITENIIVKMIGVPPKKYNHVVFDTESLLAFFKDDCGNNVQLIPLSITDARYPDWKRVAHGVMSKPVDEIGLCGDYLSLAGKIGKIFNKDTGVKITFRGASDSIMCTFENTNAELIIMPMRIK